MCNKLALNIDKTYFTLFTNNHVVMDDNCLNINQRTIDCRNEGKFLGVHIDRYLRFVDHIKDTAIKISKSIGIIYEMSSCVPKSFLISLYYSLVYPYLIYCLPVWGATYNEHLKPLFVH